MATVTLDEVRRHLQWNAAPPLLGAVLNELYSALTGRDPRLNLAAPLELADASAQAWHRALVDHAYVTVVSPALARHENELQAHSAAVLEFWAAAQRLCGWLAGLMHAQRAADTTRSLEALRQDLFPATGGGGAVERSDTPTPTAPAVGGAPPSASTGLLREVRRTTLPRPELAPDGGARFLIGMQAGLRYTADLSDTQSPHVLVAGPPGSGKTEWLRTALASLLATHTPATLRLALIDPHGSLTPLYAGSFLWNTALQAAGAAPLLQGLARELERRQTRLESTPRILCIIDDYADLPSRGKAGSATLQEPLARIAIAGRAAGIHLMVATRRFGRELKGALGYLPARVAFALPRKSDSRRVLGEAGAEALGRGELLYKDLGAPVRLAAVTAPAPLALQGSGPAVNAGGA